MSYTLHSLARTTPKTRAEIRALREAGVFVGGASGALGADVSFGWFSQ
jgi:hypothetical protein